jgi:poly-gamma-glutamate synthesis protein (capsule biosynthesis protein)
MRAWKKAAALGLFAAMACADEEPVPATTAPPPTSGAASATPAPSASAKSERARRELTLVAGGDVSFGRSLGQMLIDNPELDQFAPLAPLFDAADVRFVNLECPVSDQDGETVSPINKLVFNAPPAAAAALARARVDIVSLANNHAWDYGQDALFETFDHLARAKVAYVGAGRSRAQAYEPRVVTRDGFGVAFVAITAVWNQDWSPHPGREFIAGSDRDTLVDTIKKARALEGVDKVVVSHHGGYEYVDQPHDGTRDLARAAIEAGADAFIGHHPHVVQRAVFIDDKPVFYSLGNLLMRMTSGKPWTEHGLLARLTLRRDGATEVSVCPVRIFGHDLVPLGSDPKRSVYETVFRTKFEQLLRHGAIVEPDTAAELGAFGEDGCAPLRPR